MIYDLELCNGHLKVCVTSKLDEDMKKGGGGPFTVHFSIAGFLCNESPLRITPSLLIAWKGSCMLIPCHVGETLYSERLNPTGVIWYFKPFFDQRSFSYTGQLLYDSSKTAVDLMNLTSSVFRDRVRFVGDLSQGDCSLKITELHPNDSGMYGVVVAASVGNKTQRQMLYRTVRAHVRDSPLKPNLEVYPEEIQEALTASVICSVSQRSPNEPIRMILGGLEEQRLSIQKSTDENSELRQELSFVPTWKDHGKWVTCSLMNKNDEIIFQSAVKLDVKHAPKGVELIADPGTTLREGGKLSFECIVKSSNPAVLDFEWWKNDHRIDEGINGSQMEIDPVGPQHSGRYGCGASNRLGTTESAELTIDVQFAPKNVQVVQDPPREIKEGGSLNLRCQVGAANPKEITYRWHKDQQLLVDQGAILIIHNMSRGDTGDYSCEARNSVGTTDSKRLRLNVQHPPEEPQISFSRSTVQGKDAVSLHCWSTARPPITHYEWYKCPAEDILSSQQELHFQAIQPNDSGGYYCKAYNPIGQSISSVLTLNIH
ncbi:hypothetical protein JRQ81_011637 [Phrynocephalus forsythii]|uniref:B-cell receptor CD22 n=1 Tax=Phrynocephalus forsythii TaxID=171643 RepID=A0A9Q0X694_9SAUR|nr:hypothetical protein JRQ81_011637 [Phrynocephalus forsythii]